MFDAPVCCVFAEGGYPGDGVEEQLRQAGQVDRAVDLVGRRPDEDWVRIKRYSKTTRRHLIGCNRPFT